MNNIVQAASDEAERIIRMGLEASGDATLEEAVSLELGQMRTTYVMALIDYFRSKWKRLLSGEDHPQGTLYHVCATQSIPGILEHGIVHDDSPTLTTDLAGAIAQVTFYRTAVKRACSVLAVEIPEAEIHSAGLDHMGPGYLPNARECTLDLPPHYFMNQDNFAFAMIWEMSLRGECNCYWVSPNFIGREPVYASSV